ncbi:hypothetical protein SCP_1004900 [Sparassis crispa]|uniref:Uncharacterized protein n=1 Tax=Sparassis crispa TaxID=139825 RepID=A0A401GYK1_9APHY|nr:hypothetical protein SCP_1004900 [Sparassis crispa]GBE87243.1 hypothetical protein SCP_1004900 [Sparassis crispa]
MSLSVEARHLYIESLDIPEGASTRVSKGSSAAVNGGSVDTFVGGLSGLNKEDVLNSTLLAQLSANQAAGGDRIRWYNKYREVLENIGWVVQDFTFKELDNATAHGSVDQAIIAILKSYLSHTALADFKATIDAMKKPANNNANKLFEMNAWKGQESDFQLGVASASHDDVQFRIGSFTYQAQGSQNDVLFFKFGHDHVKFMYSTQNMVLNLKVYEKVRAAVNQKLGSHVKSYIDGLKL